MSWVSDVTVYVARASASIHEALTGPIEDAESDGDHRRLRRIDIEAAHGSKGFMGAIYARSFNYLTDDIIDRIIKILTEEEIDAAVVIGWEEGPPRTWVVYEGVIIRDGWGS